MKKNNKIIYIKEIDNPFNVIEIGNVFTIVHISRYPGLVIVILNKDNDSKGYFVSKYELHYDFMLLSEFKFNQSIKEILES